MRVEGYSTAEIGQRLKVTARSIRRHLQLLGERATKAGVIESLPSRRRRRVGGAR